MEYTNLNAASKREHDPDNNRGAWSDTTLEELKAFYGLSLLMGSMQFDREEMYWSNNNKHWLVGSSFGEVMTRTRFTQIKRYLHFSDDTQIANQNDKLFKVRLILDNLRKSFQEEYIPHREVSVDEAMIPFKGQLGMKQYMKDKPVKFGIKMWVAADAVSAYCYNFEVYIGKNNDIVNKNLGMAAKVVIGLTKSLEKKGYVIYTDNFYTSPVLADFLYARQTYLCGTIRTNRKGYPKALVQTAAQGRRMERGSSDWLMCGPFLATYWKDNRIVYYLSTFHTPASEENLTTNRRNKDGTAAILNITPTVQGYAAYMGGVDRLDQMSRISKSKKSIHWYRKIEVKLREISIYNAYILEGTAIDHNATNKRKRDLLSFRMDLAHQLIGNYRQQRKVFKRPRLQDNDDERLDEKAHWPTGTGSSNTVCVVCNKLHTVYKNSHPGCTVGQKST